MRRIGLLVICLLLAGCSMISGSRTAEQWLSLVYSGMIAEDNFRFSGSVVMGYEDGLALAPFTFEGEIERHKQIALYAEKSNSFVHNPVNELKFIVNNAENPKNLYEGIDPSTSSPMVVVETEVTAQSASDRWKNQLRQELESVTMQAESLATDQGKELTLIESEINQAQQELELLLQELKVTINYEITIDKLRAVATHMKEHVTMIYVKDGAEVKEYRKSNVTFDLSPTQVIR